VFKVLEKSAYAIRSVQMDFLRYLYVRIDRRNRLIVITGPRGSGKTTLLLQLAKKYDSLNQVLYVSLDDLYFTTNSLSDLAKRFHKQGGKLLLIDELHTLPTWAEELRRIHLSLDDLQVIAAGPSILDLYKNDPDLGRRIAHYPLKEMSFREHLLVRHSIKLPVVTWRDVLNRHEQVAADLLGDFHPTDYLTEYQKTGVFPYFVGDALAYHQRLLQDIRLTIQDDLPTVENVDYPNVVRYKKLLYLLAEQVPYYPNVLKLSEQTGLTRNAVVRALQLLERMGLIHALYADTRNATILNKPDRLWLRNTNMMFAIGRNTSGGALSQTFVLQHVAQEVPVTIPPTGDLLIEGKYAVAFDGKKQAKKANKAPFDGWTVHADLQRGEGKAVPLWLFGLGY